MNQPNERHMLEAIQGSPLGFYVESLSDSLHYAYEEIARLKAELTKTHQSLVDTRFEIFQDDQYNTKMIQEKERELYLQKANFHFLKTFFTCVLAKYQTKI